MIFLFVIAAVLGLILFSRPALRILANNQDKRRQAAAYSERIRDAATNNTIPGELNFALATITCTKNITAVRELLVRDAATINPFLAIETISACVGNRFLLKGNFTATRITAQQGPHGMPLMPASMERLYAANIVVQQNEDQTLTLLSEFPEDKDHDFHIRDFTDRLKIRTA